MDTIVVALGGNAILRKGEKGTIKEQYKNIEFTANCIVKLVRKYNLAITHGNGPQVGNLLLSNEIAKNKVPELTLDICNAYTQGGIGYMIQQVLKNKLEIEKISKPVVAIITQVLVDINDENFKTPTKPIGPFYDEKKIAEYVSAEKWHICKDADRGYRRVVASPMPIDIIEKSVIKQLINNNCIVIACGGGGIPVIKVGNQHIGVPAVIDKDLVSALFATAISAKILLIITDIPKVAINFGKSNQRFVDELSYQDAKKYLEQGEFAKGSMYPKIEAALRFIESGGEKIIITSPENSVNAVFGKAGTTIHA